MQREAAIRILEALIEAAEGNYYRQGWDMYIRRSDVEQLALGALPVKERKEYITQLRTAINEQLASR